MTTADDLTVLVTPAISSSSGSRFVAPTSMMFRRVPTRFPLSSCGTRTKGLWTPEGERVGETAEAKASLPSPGLAERAVGSLRARAAVPWLVLVGFMTWLAGMVGTIASWFPGDLGYHLAVSRTIFEGDLNGSGPYAGLPSYYGGVFSWLWALAEDIGISPDTALSVVSWFEPLLWILACGYLGGTLFRQNSAALCFTILTLLGMGLSGSQRVAAVREPNIAGQVFWPLFPRDIAFWLMFVAAALALRRHWAWGALLAGMAIATEAQVGVIAVAVTVAGTLATYGWRLGWIRAAGVGAVAAASSSWWWGPRMYWTVVHGLAIQNGERFTDLPVSVGTVIQAYGPIVVVAMLAVVAAARRSRRGQAETFLWWWLAVSAAVVATSLLVASEVLAFRRALVIASPCLAALATLGIERLAPRFGARWRPIVAPFAAVAMVLPSVPAWVSTSRYTADHFTSQVLIDYRYADAAWGPVWKRLRGHDSPMLVAPADAVMAWLQTGRPVDWMPRPGYIKAGFDVGRSTGWSEQSRQAEVQNAFSGGLPTLCSYLSAHRDRVVVMRSMPGAVGVLDVHGSERISKFFVGSKFAARTDLSATASLPLQPGEALAINAGLLPHATMLSVWESPRAARPSLALESGGTSTRWTAAQMDGSTLRLDFDLSRAAPRGMLVLRNTTNRRVLINRVVGYVAAKVSAGPAIALRPDQVCGPGPLSNSSER
jgi:hypothetical protein